MKPFLEEGLTQYVKAKDTIAAFERQVADLLEAAVDGREKQRWSPLKSPSWRQPRPGAGSAYGYWIWISITGRYRRDEAAAIDCGLWWNAPKTREPIIIYAEFYDMPKEVMGFSWDDKKNGIRSFENSGKTLLYLPIPKSLEIADPLDRLLDALLEQLA